MDVNRLCKVHCLALAGSKLQRFFAFSLPFSMDDKSYKFLLKKAGDLLARRSYSRGELRDRLAQIAEISVVEPVLDRLEQVNLLNDADYAYNFALCRIQRDGWGPAKVQSSLLRRQVAETTVQNALDRVLSELGSEPALAEYVRKFCRTKGVPTDPKGVRKLILHLLHRGFDEESVFRVLRRTIPVTTWRRFETGE